MESSRVLKAMRRIGRLWFYFCTAWLLTLLVAEQGVVVAVTVQKHGAIFTLLLLYSLALVFFGRWVGNRKNEREHPVSMSPGYCFIHGSSPLFGGLAGSALAAAFGTGHYMLWISAGSFAAGAAAWLILSPAVYAGEMLLPSSRRHRAARAAFAKALRREEQLAKERALAEVELSEAKRLQMWNEELQPKARELASLLITGPAALEEHRGRIVDIGIEAWQLGGAGCMRHLHSMAVDASKAHCNDMNSTDFISPCWDGIGNW